MATKQATRHTAMDRSPQTFLQNGYVSPNVPPIRVKKELSSPYDDDEMKVQLDLPNPANVPKDMKKANKIIKRLNGDYYQRYHGSRGGIGRWANAHNLLNYWTMNREGMAEFREKAVAAGYEWIDERDEGGSSSPSVIQRAATFARDNDTIRVRYDKDGGRGIGEMTGMIGPLPVGGGRRITFIGAKGDQKTLKRADDGEPELRGDGRNPYMGTVVSVTILPGE